MEFNRSITLDIPRPAKQRSPLGRGSRSIIGFQLRFSPALWTALVWAGLLAGAQAQTNYQRLKSFSVVDFSGASPSSPPIQGRDGALYATTRGGGDMGLGTIFKLFDTAANQPPLLEVSMLKINGASLLRWPSGAVGFQLECTDKLSPPIEWRPVTSGITDDGASNSYLLTPQPGAPHQFYRLRQQ